MFDMPEKENSDYYNTCLREEEKITRNTLSRFKREFEFYERSINLIYDITTYLCDLTKSKRPSDSKAAILFMIPRLLGTMQSIRVLNLKGYYYDDRILGRSILENFGLCVYLARNQEEAGNWMKGKDISIPKIKLYSELASFLAKEIEKYEKEGNAEYGKLSSYVHASLWAIAPSFLEPGKKPRVVMKVPPFFSKKQMSPLALFPMTLLIIIREVFKNELGNIWIDKILNILREYKMYAESTF